MAANKTRSLTIPLAIFAILTWAVFLGGLAASQRACTAGVTQPGVGNPAQVQTNGLNTQGLSGVYGWSGNVLGCSQLYRYAWFVMAWTFVVLLGVLICAAAKHAMGTALHFTRLFWVGMLAITVLLNMIMSEAFLASLSSSGLSNTAAYQATTAGAIMTVASLVFLLFAVGTHWDHQTEMGHKEIYPAGTTAVDRV